MSKSKNSPQAGGPPFAPPKVVGKIVVVKATDELGEHSTRIVIDDLNGSPSSIDFKNWTPASPTYPPQSNQSLNNNDFQFPVILSCGTQFTGTTRVDTSQLGSHTGVLYFVDVWLDGSSINPLAVAVEFIETIGDFPPAC